jgi:hypothetical protein
MVVQMEKNSNFENIVSIYSIVLMLAEKFLSLKADMDENIITHPHSQDRVFNFYRKLGIRTIHCTISIK